jgi:hypothetical protein
MGLHLNQNRCHFLRIEMRLCYKLRAPIHSFRHQASNSFSSSFSHPQHGAPAAASILPHLMLCLFIVNHPVKYIFRFHTPQRKLFNIIYALAFKSRRAPTFKSAAKKFTCWKQNFPIGDQCSHAAECIHSLALLAAPPLKITIISLARVSWLRCW